MPGTTYQEVVDAVGRYYGVGSDQWAQIAQYGIAAHDAESILSQVPDVEIIKNNAGTITGYAYNAPATLNTGGIASEINSNVALGTQANGNTFTTSIPASGTVNQSGNISVTSGAKNISTGNTVSTVIGKISAGIAAVSMGCKLGAMIDSAIYNAAPDFWNQVCPTVDPQTWNSIAGTNKAGQSFVNALFGTDSQGNTTMYLPEDVASYMAYCMAEQGFFNQGGATGTTGKVPGVTPQVATPFNFAQFPYGSGSSFITINENNQGSIVNTDPVYCVTNYSQVAYNYYYIYVCSKSGFRWSQTGTMYGAQTIYTSDGPVYWAQIQFDKTLNPIGAGIPSAPFYGVSSPTDSQCYHDIIYTGEVESTPAHEGVTPQEGQTFPDTTTWTSPAATAQALATQFSDDYQNNAIYTDVPQADGTTTRIKYIPVPTTATTNSNEQAPTNTTVTYNQTIVNEGTSTEDIVNTIVRYITQTQTQTATETPNPPNTPNPTDTGTGSTPPVVAPTGQASALFAVYNPSQAQLNSFGAWLWSSNFIDQVLKLFNNPMQAIIGLHKVFASPSLSGSGNIRVGYLDSGVDSNIVGAQYTTVNCGSVKVAEQFGNVFDYTDTQVRLYLPFIGIVDLDTADVMRGTVSVVYHVDVITGACLAEVKVSRDASGGTLYQYAGDASVRYPISSGSYMGVVSGVLSAVGGVASAVMTGGATLPLAAGAIAGGLSGAHTQVQHSGNFAGNAGAMGAKKPYIIIERPQTMIAKGYGAFQGNGANSVRTVGEMQGYFKFSDVHTESISGAAQSEIEAIRAALESGVIA